MDRIQARESIATSLLPTGRHVVYRTRGRRHGPIVRLVSPSDIGELIKPFVFLDRFDFAAGTMSKLGYHPHSGIATLTLVLEGGLTYEDSTGSNGTVQKGAVEWMQAGGGVWHTGDDIGGGAKGYQLWVALPPEMETAPPSSQHVDEASFARDGPARVLMGQLGKAKSPFRAPSPMNFLEVRLSAGETWRYDTPENHDVAWIAMYQGTVFTPERVSTGELVVFAESHADITFIAQTDTLFVLGSAAKHPHALVLGTYSVHTSHAALACGESTIRRIGSELRRVGKI